jgi:hypothetical protein
MKTGETIEINGVMLEAIAEISDEDCCKGCFFNHKGIKCPEDDDKILLCTIDDIIIFKKK